MALTTVSARFSSNLVSHYVDDQGRLELQFLQSMHSGFFAKVDGRHWDQVFAVALNNLWWCRNKTIFENYQLQPDAVAIQILAKTDAITESIQYSTSIVPVEVRVQAHGNICWNKPPNDHFKLNTDGAINNDMKKAVAGRVFRDSNGKVNFFAADVGYCPVVVAENSG